MLVLSILLEVAVKAPWLTLVFLYNQSTEIGVKGYRGSVDIHTIRAEVF